MLATHHFARHCQYTPEVAGASQTPTGSSGPGTVVPRVGPGFNDTAHALQFQHQLGGQLPRNCQAREPRQVLKWANKFRIRGRVYPGTIGKSDGASMRIVGEDAPFVRCELFEHLGILHHGNNEVVDVPRMLTGSSYHSHPNLFEQDLGGGFRSNIADRDRLV